MNYTVKSKSPKAILKVRNGIIDRFFDKANELPHSITSCKEVNCLQDIYNKTLFICESANYTLVISHHREKEFILYDILKEPEIVTN